MLAEDFFLNTETIEVWPSFGQSILPRLDRADTPWNVHEAVIPRDDYDNYLWRQYGMNYIPLATVINLLRVQLH